MRTTATTWHSARVFRTSNSVVMTRRGSFAIHTFEARRHPAFAACSPRETGTMAEAAPDLGVPPSANTVVVDDLPIIDATATIPGHIGRHVPGPARQGLTTGWHAGPSSAFLSGIPGLQHSLLFDLGIRTDWQNLSPAVRSRNLRCLGWEIQRGQGRQRDPPRRRCRPRRHRGHRLEPPPLRTTPVTRPRSSRPTTSLVVGPGLPKSHAPPGPALSPGTLPAVLSTNSPVRAR
ncbi:hypothetical protein VTG60DRAFT_6595 [Thermothelomyces hinnuleus]